MLSVTFVTRYTTSLLSALYKTKRMQECQMMRDQNGDVINAKMEKPLRTTTFHYHVIVDDNPQTTQQQKQQRDEDSDVFDSLKRFKNSLSLDETIEIKNVPNDNSHPNEVIKTIAVNVEINDSDISDSYQLKKSHKVIVEIATLN